jgi:hypothetical protein
MRSVGAGPTIPCLINFVLFVLVAVIVLWLAQVVFDRVGLSLPPRLWLLIRVLVGLLIILRLLQCVGFMYVWDTGITMGGPTSP